MSTYELVVIHAPVITEQQHAEQLERIKSLVAKNGGEVTKTDIWGKRRMAYMIQKFREGIYTLFLLDAPSTGTCLPELERYCKIEETVIRHLITKAVVGKRSGPLPPQEAGAEGEQRERRPRPPRREQRDEQPEFTEEAEDESNEQPK